MQTTPDQAEATRLLLTKLWEKNLPQLRDRLDQLSVAAAAMAANTLTSAAQEAAASTAHKLAGSLGMFGYPRGTDLARQIEVSLTSQSQDGIAIQQLTRELRAELGVVTSDRPPGAAA